jgi:hypothetical protein
VTSFLVAAIVLYFLPTFIRGFAIGLLVVAAVVVVAHAQTSTTNCFKNGAGTVCETRDAQGRTSARTTCWPPSWPIT